MEGEGKKILGGGLENEKMEFILTRIFWASEASQNAFGVIGLYPGVCEFIYVYNFHLLYVSYI
jgi:hypothetical protein